VVSASDFDRLNDECASHLAAMRAAGARCGRTLGDEQSRLAGESLEDLSVALVDAFRYLANAAVTIYCLPLASQLRSRLTALQVSAFSFASPPCQLLVSFLFF